MVDSLLVSFVMIMALFGGGAVMYVRISNVNSTEGGIRLIGDFLIFVVYIAVVIVMAFGFMSG